MKSMLVLLAVLALGATACEVDREADAAPEPLVRTPDVDLVDTSTRAAERVAPAVAVPHLQPAPPPRPVPAPVPPPPVRRPQRAYSPPPPVSAAPSTTAPSVPQPAAGGGGVTGLVEQVSPLP